MDTQYRQFDSSDISSTIGSVSEHNMPPQTGMKRIVVYVLYGVLVLLLLILLMVTGIRFTQLNKEVTDVKLHLGRLSHGLTASSSAGAAPVVDVPVEKITPVRGTCREGWISYERGCYLLSKAVLNWHQAEQQCITHGAHLLVFNTVAELDFISKVVEIQHNYWIGLVERAHEGHWSWVDGMDFNSMQTFWDEGQPDDWDYRENGEDCGQIHSSEKRKRKLWNDADCSLLYRYICETRV
ncbi:perlucin-like protein [Symphorus nematophorus]